METLPGVAPPEQQNTYFYIGQHETKRTVPVTTELGNQAQDAGVSLQHFSMSWSYHDYWRLGILPYVCNSSMRLR